MVSMVVMGVAGCGKSTLGEALRDRLNLPLIEGDDYHPPANVVKMRGGIPLTDEDRVGWLDTLGEQLRMRRDTGAILTCSALKKAYRDRLRAAAPDLKFIFLEIDRDSARQRVEARAKLGNHMFSPKLVDSQFATLESPVGEAGVLPVKAVDPVENLTEQVIRWKDGGYA